MKLFLGTILCFFWTVDAYAQSDRSLVREGNRLYKENKYADAEVSYRKALEKNRELSEGAFNLGDALYQQQRFDEAARQYQLAATGINDPETKAKALHNLGNALVKGQKIAEGIDAYKQALKLNPGDRDTKYNLEYAKALLNQQQQQQQKKQDKDQKDDKQNKEQEKQDGRQQQDQQENQPQDQQPQGEDRQQQPQEQKLQEQQQAQERKEQISKQDAERILEALKNEERNIQKKLHKRAPARVRVEKDW